MNTVFIEIALLPLMLKLLVKRLLHSRVCTVELSYLSTEVICVCLATSTDTK